MAKNILTVRPKDVIYAEVPDADSKSAKAKEHVVRVTKVLEDSVLGYLVQRAHLERKQVEIDARHVRINLGPNPPGIRVGSVNLSEVFFHTTEHPYWGTFHWSFEPEEDALKRVHQSFSAVRNWLKENGLGAFNQLPLAFEIYHKSTKHVGHYRHPGAFPKHPGVIRLCPLTKSQESIVGHTAYIVGHEIAHAIDYILLHNRPKLQSRWLDLFYETLGPDPVEKDMLEHLLGILKGVNSVKEFRAAVAPEEDQKHSADSVLEYLSRAYHLKTFDIDCMMIAGDLDRIDKYWPTGESCFLKNLRPVVSEYATENPRELIAEAFAFYMCGAKLPKAVRELVEVSIQAAVKALPKVLESLSEGDTDSVRSE